ncbi:MAG: Txe/YoeB family addiction module toxin [Fusobacterium sp.]|nr:Txe/YoeB family addiction module toxin [Fusobacterium sp.]
MSSITFAGTSFEDYLYWQKQDKKILKRINKILQDIERNGYEGIAKPEPLKYNLSGYWSRRIDDENRIVYKIVDSSIIIFQLKGHY